MFAENGESGGENGPKSISPQVTRGDLNSVLYKAASSLALPLLNAYLLIVSGFCKSMYR